MPSNERKIRDATHLLNIFPEVIWRKIFEKVLNEDDKECFSNSSLFLRHLLLHQRTQFLFKSVWKILARKYEQNINAAGSIYCDDVLPKNEQLLGLHSKKLLVNQINRIRLTCRSWSNAILDYYQNHLLHFQLQEQLISTLAAKWTVSLIEDRFLVHNPEKATTFLSHFANTHDSSRNPFFGKSVSIEFRLGDGENNNQLTNKIFYILSTYGRHIWYCDISITYSSDSSAVVCYSRIRDALELMPNLKVFHLGTGESLLNLSNDTIKQLKAEINARPLPTLRDLQMLSIRAIRTPIFLELLRSNAHIVTLDAGIAFPLGEGYYIYPGPLPNLTTFCIKIHVESHFKMLMNPQVKWPLIKLSIDFGQCEFLEWQRIFTMMEDKWAESLTHLEIILPQAITLQDRKKNYRECGELKLNLPRLKVLMIWMRNLTCVDFLLPLKDSLDNLQISIHVYERVEGFADLQTLEKKRVIKLLSCASRPLESNIWTLFSQLQQVHVDLYVRFERSVFRCAKKFELKERWSQSRREWECKINGNNCSA